MRINRHLKCSFPCNDVEHKWIFPEINIDPTKVNIVVVSEAPPPDKKDYYYSGGFFDKTTCMAFNDAGYAVKRIKELTDKGFYFTTAIKCCKKDYLVSSKTLNNCSNILFRELEQFPNTKVVMCMGDFAIKCVNYIMKESLGRKVIPTGSTYKIRSGNYIENSVLYIPSYTQTGDSFNIEKSKRKMIAEDIKKAMEYVIIS
ncbi:uracil-DNA glycosylase [candidate division WOR-3 bacterium]|nr:uracil-DNA glycosylase [candidate division WOR-3 bacterium]